jgi:hypothetical protein
MKMIAPNTQREDGSAGTSVATLLSYTEQTLNFEIWAIFGGKFMGGFPLCRLLLV